MCMCLLQGLDGVEVLLREKVSESLSKFNRNRCTYISLPGFCSSNVERCVVYPGTAVPAYRRDNWRFNCSILLFVGEDTDCIAGLVYLLPLAQMNAREVSLTADLLPWRGSHYTMKSSTDALLLRTRFDIHLCLVLYLRLLSAISI
jgi:hypothetical protein